MAEIKEVLSSIKETLITPIQDSIEFRAKNAFFGSFVISWIVWNWKDIFYFVLSKDDVLYKISLIKSSLPVKFESCTLFPYSYIVIPIIFATILTLSYPLFMYGMLKVHRWIFDKIDLFNNQSNTSKVIRRKNLTEAEVENEGIKAVMQARTALRIALMRQKEAEKNSNVDSLWKKESELRASIHTFESQKKEIELIIDSLTAESVKMENKITKLSQENMDILKLNEKYETTSRELVEISIEHDKIKQEKMHLEETVRDLKSDVSSMTHGVQKLSRVREQLNKIEELINGGNGSLGEEDLQFLLRYCRAAILSSRSE